MKLLAVRNIRTCEVICRCDARCYNAKKEDCAKCCCAGFNHAVGEDAARENSLTLVEQMQNFVKATFGDDAELVVYARMFQKKLPI